MDLLKRVFVLTLCFAFATTLWAQTTEASKKTEDPTLFTLDGEPVKVSEFLYVYNKNSGNEEGKFSKESLDDYLKLYVNFRLKVHEAEELGMDTITSLNDELDTYRKQLSKSYLYDRDVNDKLLKEAYDRLQEEVNASHILIRIEEPGLPSDTLAAYNEAMQLRRRIQKGEKFEDLAKKYSADKSAETNGGNIGWFTAMQTVYPFETVAYNTEVGTISKPVRTRFGYHILRVNDKREAQGEITVAHIMLKLPPNPAPALLESVEKRAQEVYEKAKAGDDWEELAKQYSEDKTTKLKGGMLPAFGTGRMVESFEKAAFSLKNDGDIAEPVQTEYGFHIIKRISKKKNPTFDELKNDLKKRVERDSRSEIAKNTLLESIKEEYQFKENSKAKKALYNRIGEKLPAGKLSLDDVKGDNSVWLFKLADIERTQQDFINFLDEKHTKKRPEPTQKLFDDYYNKFVEETLLTYEETQLSRKYPEFRMLMGEYRDGILLFELTDEKVWTKAVKDTNGLKEFYETVKMNYMWPERAKTEIYTVSDESKVAKAQKLAAKKGAEVVKAKLNKGDEKVVTVRTQLFVQDDDARLDELNWTPGVGTAKDLGNGKTEFVRIVELVEPEPKTLLEAKGFIVSDYQEYLEQEWIEDLKAKYPVKINQDVLNSLVK